MIDYNKVQENETILQRKIIRDLKNNTGSSLSDLYNLGFATGYINFAYTLQKCYGFKNDKLLEDILSKVANMLDNEYFKELLKP